MRLIDLFKRMASARLEKRMREAMAKKIYTIRASETGAIYHDDTITIWKKSPWKKLINKESKT